MGLNLTQQGSLHTILHEEVKHRCETVRCNQLYPYFSHSALVSVWPGAIEVDGSVCKVTSQVQRDRW